MKNHSRTRLMAVGGATLALAIVGTAAVSAHPGDRGDQRGFGRDRGPAGFQRGDGLGGPLQRGLGRLGPRGGLGAGLMGRADRFVRRESTVQTDDGVVTHRVDNGSVTASSDGTLDYTLATGDTASVSTDDDTTVVAFSTQSIETRRGLTRERLVPEEIALADIEADAEVTVWAQSLDDGSFLAQRIVVHPTPDGAADDATDAAADDAAATDDPVADDAAAADTSVVDVSDA